MRRDATASKCFVQLVGNRKLAGEKALERPSLTASELNFISKLCRITGPGPDRLSIPCFSRNAQVVYLRFCFCRLRHARGLLAWPRKPAWFCSSDHVKCLRKPLQAKNDPFSSVPGGSSGGANHEIGPSTTFGSIPLTMPSF